MRSFWRFLPLTGLAPKSWLKPRIATSEVRLKLSAIGLHSRLIEAVKRESEPRIDANRHELGHGKPASEYRGLT